MRGEMNKYSIPNDQRFVQFVQKVDGGWSTEFMKVAAMYVLPKGMDLGLVELATSVDSMEPQPYPLIINEMNSLTVRVGKDVGTFGYPYGEELLERKGRIYRFGPILQQGYISAIAPFDTPGAIEELLLDMRAHKGMSGSPVFLPESGDVIGIIYESWEPTAAFALPLTPGIIELLLNAYLAAKDEQSA